MNIKTFILRLVHYEYRDKENGKSMCFWQGIVQEARTARGVLEHDRLKMITIDGLASKFQTESQLWQVVCFYSFLLETRNPARDMSSDQ